MTKEDIPYEAMRQLSSLKYFYEGMVEGCVKAIAHQNRITLTDEERSGIVEQVKQGFANLER